MSTNCIEFFDAWLDGDGKDTAEGAKGLAEDILVRLGVLGVPNTQLLYPNEDGGIRAEWIMGEPWECYIDFEPDGSAWSFSGLLVSGKDASSRMDMRTLGNVAGARDIVASWFAMVRAKP